MSPLPSPQAWRAEARSVTLVQWAKTSPQPFKEGTGGNVVKGAICRCDIGVGAAIYVRVC